MKVSNRIKYELPAILIGVIFVLSGLNGLLDIFSSQPASLESSDLALHLKDHGVLGSLIVLGEIVGGIFLIFGSMGNLGVLLLAPVTLGVLLFHAYLSPAGLWHGYALSILEIFLLVFYWRNIAQMLGWRRSQSSHLK